jgi:ClpP class serine protease
LGKLPVPVPYELSFPDAVNALRNSKDPEHKKALFGSLKMFGARQKIDQQLVDEIGQYRNMIKKLTGKKKGGAVNKPKVTDNLDTMRLALTRKKKAAK